MTDIQPPNGEVHWISIGAIEKLRELVALSWSASRIAGELSSIYGHTITRNAVIGKMHRMGIKSNNKPPPKPPRVRKPYLKSMGNKFIRRQPEKDLPLNEVPNVFTKTLMDLSLADCRYPTGDPDNGGIFFCGETARQGDCYCAQHHRLCRGRLRGRPRTRGHLNAPNYLGLLRDER